MKKTVRNSITAGTTVFLLSLLSTPAGAGNSKMVEGRMNTLDKINKEAVRQLPDIPPRGRIDLQAEGTQYGERVRIKVKRYTVSPVEERPRLLDGDNTSDTSAKEKQNDE